MGFEDRDYVRHAPVPARRTFGHPRAGSVTAWLIFLNILVYVADRFLAQKYRFFLMGTPMLPLEGLGHFSKYMAIDQFQVWRFITFQFLHANFDHLVFNMLTLYFFGPMVEAYFGARQFVVFYLLSGIGGAVMYLLLLAVGLRIGGPAVPLIGASAGIFGILIAATRIAPNTIALLFGIVPVRLRMLVWLFIGYAVFQVLFRGVNAGGEAAHLGGAAAGFVLTQWPDVIERIAWLGKRAPPF